MVVTVIMVMLVVSVLAFRMLGRFSRRSRKLHQLLREKRHPLAAAKVRCDRTGD
jgi:hypothetical protein